MASNDHNETTLQEIPEDKTTSVTIESEMKSSYLDYAMSIIVSRALPDVRDGLKLVLKFTYLIRFSYLRKI